MSTAVAMTAAPVVPPPPRVAQAAGGQSGFVGRVSDSVASPVGSGTGVAAVIRSGSIPVDQAAGGTPNQTAAATTTSNTNAKASPVAASDKASSNAANPVIVSANPTFAYDPQAQRVVMLTRDRKTGTVETQIPSEMALRQYEQAAKRVREDVATAQQSGSSPVQSSTLAAANLGIVIPFAPRSGSATAGASSGRGGGARYNVVV